MKETCCIGCVWKLALSVGGSSAPQVNHTFHCALARQMLSMKYTCILVNKTSRTEHRDEILGPFLLVLQKRKGDLLAPRETFLFLVFPGILPLWEGEASLALTAFVFIIDKNKASSFKVSWFSFSNSWIFLVLSVQSQIFRLFPETLTDLEQAFYLLWDWITKAGISWLSCNVLVLSKGSRWLVCYMLAIPEAPKTLC